MILENPKNQIIELFNVPTGTMPVRYRFRWIWAGTGSGPVPVDLDGTRPVPQFFSEYHNKNPPTQLFGFLGVWVMTLCTLLLICSINIFNYLFEQ